MSDRSHAAFDERLLRDVNAQAVRSGGNGRLTTIAARARGPTETAPRSAVSTPPTMALRVLRPVSWPELAAASTRTRQALDVCYRRLEAGNAAPTPATRSECVRA